MKQANDRRQFDREADGMYFAVIFLDNFDLAEA
jgi:hypothetical protein